MTKNTYFALFLGSCILTNTSCDQEDLALNQDIEVLNLTAGFSGTDTRVSFKENDLELISCWEPDEQVSVLLKGNGNVVTEIGNIKMRNISSDGKSAMLSVGVPEGFTKWSDGTYQAYGFTQSCNLIHKGSQISVSGSFMRSSFSRFHAPVFFYETFDSDKQEVTFKHYMTYELLHITNSTNAPIEFSLCGFSGTSIWYKTQGYVDAETLNFSVNYDAPSPQNESDRISIPAGHSDIIVSAYIPNGQKIEDVTLVARIDGKYRNSTNKLSSNLTLQQGHAYHMYAEWDGKELKFVEKQEHGSAPDTHEYVDLGLPSGTLWATCNVGANSPEEYGDYFAWGETEPKEYYSWDTYKWCQGSNSTMTKYCTSSSDGTVDNKTTLELEDDAAHVNWGGAWRMPTLDEREDLLLYCSLTWTTQNGVNGYKVKGPNGNSIFLPAAGYRYYGDLYNAGSDGYIWFSTLYNGNIANYLGFFYSDSYDFGYCGYRCGGLSVRPVCQPSVLVTSITIKGSSAHIKQGETLQLRAEVKPENATNKYIAWSSDDTSVAIISDDGLVTAVGSGQVIIKATAKDGSGVSATFVIIIDPSGDTGSHEYVDLGLPSGLKWATCNVGANSPEEYGDYFAWGETEPKEYYLWDTYKWCRGDEYSMTKYCTDSKYGTVDNKTTLEPEDDAAHVNWGGAWRMSTRDEQYELRNKCSWTWTTQNGVNGYKVKGPNGNSIFLPVAGRRIVGDLNDAGSDGDYWSSSLDTSNASFGAYCLYFHSYSYVWDSNYRYYGCSVRPVCQ